MLIDLQFHSIYSDGYLTPTEVAKFIAGKGVKIAALTDHNTVSGLDEFRTACKKFDVKPITGLEFYVKVGHKKINMLWFNFNDANPALHDVLRDTQVRRRAQVRKSLEKLIKHGFKINTDKILDKFHHYIPINRLVNEVMKEPRNMTKARKDLLTRSPRIEEILRKYFYNKKINVLHESYISAERIIKLKKSIGGQIILNHPGKHNQLKRPLLEKIKKLGFDGIEVLSPHHNLGAIMYAQYMAKEYDFIATGGSDFHLSEGGKYPLQNSWDYFKIDSEKLRGIKKIIG
jgi:hypothetical protein